jgi:Leucine-rich repeat (LRR) protein
MATSEFEINQLVKHLALDPLFDWETCPPKLLKIFMEVVDLQLNCVSLHAKAINAEEIFYVISFLKAYPNVTKLDISSNPIGSIGIEALVRKTALITLNISSTNIHRHDGSEPYRHGHNHYDFNIYTNCDIHSARALFLALRNNMSLKTLNISKNRIYEVIYNAGVGCLAQNNSLTDLNMSNSHVDDMDAKLLSKNTTLTILNLSNTYIGNTGAKFLAHMMLRDLNISNTYIGKKAVKFLMRNMTLRSLNISKNQIGDDTAKFLANYPNLTALDISESYISGVGILPFKSNMSLMTLNLSGNSLHISDVKNCANFQNRIATFNTQKLAILMGTHKRVGCKPPTQRWICLTGCQKKIKHKTPILKFSMNPLYDKNLLKECFSFLEPMPLKVIHSLAFTIEDTSLITTQPLSHDISESDTSNHTIDVLTFMHGRRSSASYLSYHTTSSVPIEHIDSAFPIACMEEESKKARFALIENTQ